MLRDAVSSTHSDVQFAVEQLLIEDARFDELERRSLHREYLVRPVTIAISDTGELIGGMSRNISGAGICILARKPVADRAMGRISIHGLGSQPTAFRAECRWSRPFGAGWYMSGWHFIGLV